MTEPVASSLASIVRWFVENAPEATPQLRVGRSELSGVGAPLVELLAAADGQHAGEAAFDQHRLMSWAEVQGEKDMMDELAETEAWGDEWWDPAWHPFATDDSGQLLVVDERDGRVLAFAHDDDGRRVLASSLGDYFAAIAQGLVAGELVFDPDHGVVTPEELSGAHQRAEDRSSASIEGQRSPPLLVPALLAVALGAALIGWLSAR